jgi:hypothetical protein
MAEPVPVLVGPAPTREAVIGRDTLLLTAVWIRWLTTFQADTQQRLASLEARVTALETP